MIICDGPTCQGRTAARIPNLAWFKVERGESHPDVPNSRLEVHHFCGAGCLTRWLRRYL